MLIEVKGVEVNQRFSDRKGEDADSVNEHHPEMQIVRKARNLQ